VRVLPSMNDSPAGVEPLAGLAVRLREPGAQVRVQPDGDSELMP
jgi:hypothetical protein